MAQETKTRNELAALVKAEIRRHPECADVQMVTITRPSGLSWDVAIVRRGSPAAPESLRRVEEIVSRFRARYELGTAEQKARPKRRGVIGRLIKSMRRR
jgi:hypothetical protein